MRVHNLAGSIDAAQELLFSVAKSKRGEIMPRGKRKVLAKKHAKPEKEERCNEEQAFRCIDGGVYYSLKELANALDTMSQDTYYYHANDGRNDFASWMQGVFGKEQLAESLRKAGSRERSEICLLRDMLGSE